MIRRVLAAHLVALALAGGCNCQTQSFGKVQPTLQMDDTPIDFGEVAVNSTSLPRTITLKAVTSAAITISATIENDAAGVFAISQPAPTTVPASGKTSIAITFSPRAVMPYSATLVVTSDDPNPARTTHHVPILGSGESPQIEVTPDHLGLSAVACPPGASSTRCRDEQTVTVHNTGLVDLTLGVVKIVGADASSTPPDNLTLKQLVSTAPIASGDSLPITVLWRPHGDANVANSQTGDFTARLEIPSDDPAHPVTYVQLAAHADPASAPHVCLNALSVTQRRYYDAMSGTPMVRTESVKTGVWANPSDATRIHDVLPGMTVTFTTLPFTETDGIRTVDQAAVQHTPCTYDPQDLPLSVTWALTQQPTISRTGISARNDSGIASADGELPIDAAGTYQVTVRVADTLGLASTATMTLEAPLHDDLLAQLNWGDAAQGPDLDLHLIVDAGRGVTPAPNPFLSALDCYWQNPLGVWFSTPSADENAVFLRDDQGTSGLLESINLLTAPIDSRYRAVVHYFDGTEPATPTLQLFHTGVAVPPGGTTDPVIRASRTISRNEIWIGAKIEFINCPANCTTGMCCTPTITPLDQFCTFTPDQSAGEFSGVVSGCTNGGSL